MYYVYILQSLIDKSLHIGFSADLRSRVKRHNSKQVVSTKDKTPWKLIYYEAYTGPQSAIQREKQIKSWSRKKKEDLIKYLNPDLKDLYETILD